LTTTEPDEKDNTAPIELPHPSAPAVSRSESSSDSSGAPTNDTPQAEASSVANIEPRPVMAARAANPAQQDVMFVPLAVSIGDGFKFGCGFFLAMVLALLVGFVLLALLFVVTSLFGLNLPISR
jgi:hypothetical protein